MPRKAIDYSKTIIYKLIKNDDYENENVYVGSTTDFIRRKSSHTFNCCNENSKRYNFKVYQIIRENGGWSEWNMIEIEKFPCEDKREAEAREEWWRCEFNANLNTNRAFITAEQLKQHHKQYKTKHADKIKQFQKEYYTEHAEKLKELIKQYKIKHAEKLKELNKQYRTKNAEKIYQKYDCECGGKYTHQSKTTHFKTKKHQNYINNKN